MKKLRNIHLLEAARQIAASGNFSKISDIANHAATSPAPFYYVEYSRAVRYMHLHQLNKLPQNLTSTKRDMWMEIFGKATDLMQRNPRLSPERAVQRVLCRGQASSFFIKPVTAARILQRHRPLLINQQNNIAI